MDASPPDDSPAPGDIKSYEPDEFMRTLGATLLAWQHVEQAVFIVFHTLMRTSSVSISGAVFYAIESFEQRQKMVRSLMKSTVDDRSILGEWSSLNTEVQKANEDRNQLAHRMAEGEYDDATGKMDLSLVQSPFRPSAMTKKDQRKFDTERLNQLHDEFDGLARKIGSFSVTISMLFASLKAPSS